MLHVLGGGGGGAMIEIRPPAAVAINTEAALSVAAGFAIPSAALPDGMPATTLTVARASTPPAITLLLTPNTIQSTQPALFTQVSVLPAAVAAGPAANVTEEIEASG
jgi:hypothetical protein